MSTRRKRGRPSSGELADREKLLDAALHEFANHGFYGITMVNIARKAGVSDSLLYYHFGSKDQLWKEAVRYKANELKQLFSQDQALLRDISGLPLLKVFLRQFVRFTAQHIDFHKIAYHELINRTERGLWLIEELLSPLHKISEQIMQEAAEAGTIRMLPFANLTAIVVGCTTTFFTHAYQMETQYGVDPFDPSEIERHGDIVVEMIIKLIEV